MDKNSYKITFQHLLLLRTFDFDSAKNISNRISSIKIFFRIKQRFQNLEKIEIINQVIRMDLASGIQNKRVYIKDIMR